MVVTVVAIIIITRTVMIIQPWCRSIRHTAGLGNRVRPQDGDEWHTHAYSSIILISICNTHTYDAHHFRFNSCNEELIYTHHRKNPILHGVVQTINIIMIHVRTTIIITISVLPNAVHYTTQQIF